ncbi:MAG: heavy metal-associated domain-containing protein [Phycisphaerales bacterium]|nr:heavy metal-associated domain-containing protein [Phycisphaerales bacterium]
MHSTRITKLLVLLPLSALLAGCAGSGGATTSSAANADQPAAPGAAVTAAHTVSAADTVRLSDTAPLQSDRVRLYVNGMGCPLCVTNVDKQLGRISGVRSATVNLGTGTVDVELYSKNRPSPAQLNKALSGDVTLVKVEELK